MINARDLKKKEDKLLKPIFLKKVVNTFKKPKTLVAVTFPNFTSQWQIVDGTYPVTSTGP